MATLAEKIAKDVAQIQSSGVATAGRALQQGKEAALGQLEGIQTEAREDLQPFTDVGVGAAGKLAGLLGLDDSVSIDDVLQDSPDFKFAFEQGQRAVETAQSASGILGSGRAAKELTRFGQGLASQQLGAARNALLQTATSLGVQPTEFVSSLEADLAKSRGLAGASLESAAGANRADLSLASANAQASSLLGQVGRIDASSLHPLQQRGFKTGL